MDVAKLDDEWSRQKATILHSDIRWAKDQGWRSLQWVILLQAAVYAAETRIGWLGEVAYVILACVVFALGLLYQIDLYRFAEKSRARFRATVPPEWKADAAERERHEYYLVFQILVVAVATLLTLAGILGWTPRPGS